MKIVIIDNYDSFTYNLSHLVKELGAEVTVVRNDQFELADLEPYSKISSRRARASQVRQACCSTSSVPMPVRNPSWVSAWVIRP